MANSNAENGFFWQEHVDAVISHLYGQEHTGDIGFLPSRYEDVESIAQEIAEHALKNEKLKQRLAQLAAQRLRALMRPVK